MSGMAFHAGVLTALSEVWDARKAEVIVGTSAGSTSAALMRAGFPPADYVARVTGSSMSGEGRRVLSGLGPLRPAAPRGRVVPPRRRRGDPAAPIDTGVPEHTRE